MNKRGNHELLRGKRVISVIIITLLVTGGFLIVFPLSQPTVKAELYHNTSAATEDLDRGDGFDYNGDTPGDGKVTWHAMNNTHYVNDDFFVNDGYIFEIEAGCMVQIAQGFVVQVGTGSGATMYANGTSSMPVVITQNVTGEIWQGIYITTRSFAYFNYTVVNGGNVIWVNMATMNMTNTLIINMDQVGVYATTSTINIMDSAIVNVTSAAIRCDSSDAVIDNNDIWGYNGTDGSVGGIDGGYGIYLEGTSMSITISNNRIYGGNGGDDMLGGGGGAGGHAIFDIYYEGDLSILGNDVIQGGRGGNNTTPTMFAGNGGMGIHVIPLPDASIVDISFNTAIIGGNGGDNLALGDGNAGAGAHAIRITDSSPESGGNAMISYNDEIKGGDGGHNFANLNLFGWTAGDGGHGIFAQDIKKPAMLMINDNPLVVGGVGGDNTGIGDQALSSSAGEGGNGILLWNSTDTLVSKCTIYGGDGGTNFPTGNGAIAGDAGHGVILYYPSLAFYSQVDISSSNLTGGDGGDDWTGGTPSLGSGEGGNALFSQYSSGICTSSNLYGGMGGDNYGVDEFGGEGGLGAGFFGSSGWYVSGGMILGGRGGDNYSPSGGGGNGSSAVYIGNNCDFITIDGVTNVIGGDGGNADTGVYGPGDASRTTIYATSSSQVTILGSNIRPGSAGLNATSGTFGINGTYGIYGTNLMVLNAFIQNNITTNDINGNTYGIWLDPSVAQISENDIYGNNVGVYILNSDAVIVGDSNEIFDNSIGIYLFNSDASIGSGNIIRNNDYGIYATNSNPTITGDQIINSYTIGIRYTTGSNGIVEGCLIDNSLVYNVYCDGLSSPEIYNSTLVASAAGSEFFITGDSHPWLLNTTFDKTKTVIADAPSNLTVNWYLHVRVVEPPNVPVDLADVWVNDTYGTNLFTGQTPPDGWIRWLVITEYVETQTGGKYYYTPHNISASEGGRFELEITNIDSSKSVIIVLGGTKFSMSLAKGWNMISIPINITDTGLSNVLSNIEGNYLAVQWFNVSDVKDQWKHYHINKGSLNDLTDIERTMGVWIYMKTADTLAIAGFDPDPLTTDIELKTGWNFVGYPSNTTRTAGILAGDAFESIAPNLDMVMHYNASDSQDQWKAWDPGVQSPDDLVLIEPGFGLFIHVNGDCTWSIDW
jgi:parallel beta-helix repeat protein